jgi:dimethylargininase
MFTRAITRRPAANFAEGLTTSVWRTPPSYALLLEQHRRYTEALAGLGVEVIELPELSEFPDAYFVEDVAVITAEFAAITNPGAPSRRGEADFIEPDISRFRQCRRIVDPGSLDGGDVLQADRHFFIGISERTNMVGAAQLGDWLQEFGYTWASIPVGAGLHLKSSVNYLGRQTLLLTEELAEMNLFSGYDRIRVPPAEAYAANTLAVNGHLLTPTGFPQTRQKLETLGLPVIELDVSEVGKMDGGLTCLSLRFN